LVDTEISNASAAIPREISRRNVKGRESGARSALMMGNGPQHFPCFRP
jgi:hypothetical protein